MRIFAGKDIREYFAHQVNGLDQEIQKEQANKLLNVKNMQLDPVLEKITPTVEQHCCYVRTLETQAQGCSEFKFHLLDDPTRTVNLTVLCFHIPEI